MQFLSVIPEQVESAAQDLAGIRSALSASYAAAAGPTTAVVSAAEDEVSTAIASIFAPTVDSARFSAPRPPRFMTSSSTC